MVPGAPVASRPQPVEAGSVELSVVVPVYDEIDSLDPLARELDAALDALGVIAEVLLVDDGSRDGSLARMRKLAASDARFRVVSLGRNLGQSAALAAGFAASRGEWVATLDADLQNDPADLVVLWALRDRAEVVGGVRTRRRDRWLRRVSSRLANAVRNRVTGEAVTDVGCSLRLVRGDLVRRVRMYRGLHRFLPTLLRLEGARVLEVPVSHRPRRHGRSKYGIRNRLLSATIDLLAVRWMQARRLPPPPPPEDEGGV